MTDLKTTQEISRTPDGTEYVRLATAGANWKATLADIFTALGGGGTGTPALPFNSIQVNNAGAFGGSADFTWLSGTGLTVGGATETLGVITPGTGNEHIAFGNYSVIDTSIFAPGDPVNQGAVAFGSNVIGMNDFATGDLSFGQGSNVANLGGLIFNINYRHTGIESVLSATGTGGNLIISSDSTGGMDYVFSTGASVYNYGSGGIFNLVGNLGQAFNNNALCSIGQIYGVEAFIVNSGHAGDFWPLFAQGIISAGATVDRANAAYLQITNSGTTTTIATVFADAVTGGGTATNVYGVYVGDHSGVGSSFSENIRSVGATSLTTFEGYHYQGNYYETTEVTAPAAPPANGVRIYAQDNGAGKTKLMALFNTGAAQQIAIQP